MITVTTFRWVPPFAQGYVRDLRVRWALEEAGLPYQTRLIGVEDKADPAYRSLQPFGQVPVLQEDGLTLFESGAIVQHIAERSEVLMPTDPAARARVIAWLFAALNSVEPAVQNLAEIDVFFAQEPWAAQRRPLALDFARTRLAALSDWLANRDHLEGRFTAADLLMSAVLRIPEDDLLAEFPVLAAYRARCQARPAFKKALADHLAVFATPEPA